MTGEKGFAVHDLSVRYAGEAHAALDHVDVSFPARGVAAIIGESGSGKSTLGQALFGALPQGAAVTGRSLFGDVDVTACTREELRRDYWGKQWGIVPQLPRAALSPVHRIGRQLADVRHGAGRAPWEAAQYAALLARFGMLQRVICAMADAGEPQWILADEPTKGLDPAVWQMVADNLGRLTARAGVSLLLITHDIPLARQLADRVIVMQAGRIVEQGADVWERPVHPYTRAYFEAQPEFLQQKQNPVIEPSTARAEASPERAVLAAEGVSKVMRDRAHGTSLRVLEECSLTIEEGRSIGLEGRSGAGKSTLVRILLGLIPADGGTVLWQGRALHTLSRAEMAEFRRSVQLITQNPEQAFDPRRTIGASLREVFAIHPVLRDGGQSDAERLTQGLEAVELTARVLERRPHELSGGELQRAVIARALLMEPRILLLDEPTTMLDVSIQAQIMQLLMRLRTERGLGTLLITHDRPLLRYFAEEIYVLDAGRLSAPQKENMEW